MSCLTRRKSPLFSCCNTAVPSEALNLQGIQSLQMYPRSLNAFYFQDLILEINELRYRLTELESEKVQYEKKLKSTKVSFHRRVL